MFSVDYATLEQIIQQFIYTGIFHVQVTNSRLLPEEGYIELQAKEGVIIACRFVTNQGKVYVWDRWEARLTKLGILNWELTPDKAAQTRTPSTAEPLPQQPSGAFPRSYRSTTPYRTINLDAYQIRRLPMLYRQVYHSIDGKRQLSDIALLLHKSEQDIVKVIDELIRQRLVALK